MAACRLARLLSFPRSFHLMAAYSSPLAASSRMKAAPSLVSFDGSRFYSNKAPPKICHFAKTHEWVSLEGDIATIGISDHAQDSLGEAVYVDLPDVGTKFSQGDVFGVVESVKAAADLYAPVGGEVTDVNNSLTSDPSLINEEPYDSGWIIKMKASSSDDYDNLMTFEEYNAFLESEA